VRALSPLPSPAWELLRRAAPTLDGAAGATALCRRTHSDTQRRYGRASAQKRLTARLRQHAAPRSNRSPGRVRGCPFENHDPSGSETPVPPGLPLLDADT
jgi:hypothetical protein